MIPLRFRSTNWLLTAGDRKTGQNSGLRLNIKQLTRWKNKDRLTMAATKKSLRLNINSSRALEGRLNLRSFAYDSINWGQEKERGGE